MTALAFVAGLAIGGILGVLLMALMQAAANADRHLED